MSDTLDETKIKEYCDKLGYGYRYFNNNVIITTKLDTWQLQKIDNIHNNCKILVKHANTAGNRKGKAKFHVQRKAQDLDYVFNNIIKPHETYNRVYDKTFRIKELLKTI